MNVQDVFRIHENQDAWFYERDKNKIIITYSTVFTLILYVFKLVLAHACVCLLCTCSMCDCTCVLTCACVCLFFCVHVVCAYVFACVCVFYFHRSHNHAISVSALKHSLFFAAGNTLLCGRSIEPPKHNTMCIIPKKYYMNISQWFWSIHLRIKCFLVIGSRSLVNHDILDPLLSLKGL